MKVENHDTTKLRNQHENLLKREIQRMCVPDSNHGGSSLRYIILLVKKYAPLYHF
jgi:hypothetical protein